MTYIVVTGVDKKSGLYHAVAVDGESFSVVADSGYISESQLLQSVLNKGTAVAPLNFSVDRASKLVQNCGDFNRFSPRGSAVVLAEIKSRGGRTLGYRLLSCANNACVNLRLEEILQREKAMGGTEHFLQNGIVRNNTVNCYPLKPFPVMTVDGPQKKVSAREIAEGKKAYPPKKAHVKPAPKEQFTKEQLHELNSCKNAGIAPNFIANPKLSPAQMRVLWVAKSKGCLSESFADPRFSTDAMKFYADRLYDKQTVADCGELLSHPELSVDELNELYTCVCQGVPYSQYIGMSATDIGVKREMSVSKYWGSSDTFDTDYMEKAANVARRLQSNL